jgi:hypothetical protein
LEILNMSTKTKKNAKPLRGGARAGAGAKPLDPEAGTMTARIPAVRCTDTQAEKYAALGGPTWLRKKLDAAKV